ncbi:MAG: hypothetical protein DRJ69_05525 [Thermoprotei archaeon]|nr:MAG: hypothetical protein DRJ69_05525 [Thermoprotei archaeon]
MDNLVFYGELYGLSRGEARERALELLDFFGLKEWRDKRVAAFSKGMKQKLALARALIHDPLILFLDEPTSALDPVSAKMVRDCLDRLAREGGRTILICTHNLFEAERYCSRVAIILSGKVVAVGSPRELKKSSKAVKIRVKRVSKELLKAVSSLGYNVEVSKDCLIVSEVEDPVEENPLIVRAIVEAGGDVVSVVEAEESLESVYLRLVGGES